VPGRNVRQRVPPAEITDIPAHGGNPALVPKWDKDDFDSIYVVTITGTGDAAKVTFSHGREGLDGQPDACPR
jgi:hypothetical protein